MLSQHHISGMLLSILLLTLFNSAWADGGVRFYAFPRSNVTLASVTTRRVDEVNPNSVPPPWLDRNNICRPVRSSRGADPTSSICDPSGLLSEHEIDRLSETLFQMYEGRDPYSLVRCPDDQSVPLSKDATGFRLAILVVRRMPFDSRTLSARAEAYAHTIFSRWGLTSNCGASVLVFISIDDRRMYLQTGRFATRYLNSHQINDVFGRMTPYMRKQRLFPALKAGIDRVGFYLGHYHGRHPGAHDSMGAHHNDPLFFRGGPAWWDLEMSILVIILLAFIACACCNGFGGPEAAQRKRERRHLLSKIDEARSEYVRASLPNYTPSPDPSRQNDIGQPFVPSVPGGTDRETPSSATGNVDPTNTLGSTAEGRASQGKAENENPVFGDRTGGASSPASSYEARLQALHFRLRSLQQEYPHLLTEDVMNKLTTLPPEVWPDPMTEAFLKTDSGRSRAQWRSRHDEERTGYTDDDSPRYYRDRDFDNRDSGGGMLGTVGGLLAAGGVGALIGSALSGNNNNNYNQNNSGYSNIGGPPPWYMGSSGNDGSGSGGGGQGVGWLSDPGNGANNGYGTSWGNDGGSGQGAGWGSNGGGQGTSWGGDGGGGNGTSWGNDGGDAEDDGGGAGF